VGGALVHLDREAGLVGQRERMPCQLETLLERLHQGDERRVVGRARDREVKRRVESPNAHRVVGDLALRLDDPLELGEVVRGGEKPRQQVRLRALGKWLQSPSELNAQRTTSPSPLEMPSSVESARRSATAHAISAPTLREGTRAGRQEAADVRYAATSWAPALLLENCRLVEELRASRLRIIQAAERERRRLEQDLHDGAQQRLVEILVRLGSAQALVDRADLATRLEAIRQAADAALDELRTLARGIHPAALRDLGPAAALRALAERSLVPIQVRDEGLGRSSVAIEEAIYFCAREAIQNSTKHAGQGAEVTVTLRRRQGAIELTISDTGVGMMPEDASNGFGVVGMRDRIEAVGGKFKILSHPRLGTCIQATIREEPAGAGRPRRRPLDSHFYTT
jgi:signal transduction histidine kinase